MVIQDHFQNGAAMETRHPVKGPFGSEIPAICNYCGVMPT